MNLAHAIKGEIARIARKEIRGEVLTLKKSSTAHRAEIASLKRRIAELEKIISGIARQSRRPSQESVSEQPSLPFRFSPKSMVAQRKRLGLSAADFGALLGVSAQSIYHWERGTSRPRASQAPAILAVRRIGKREAAALLVRRAESQ